MSDFEFDIFDIANTLISQAGTFSCSLEEAWNKWMHPILTERVTFEEVKKYIDEKVALGEEYQKLNGRLIKNDN